MSTIPDGALTVLVFDDIDHEVAADDEPFEVVHLDELGRDVPELLRMAAMYDVTEFATALKPWLLGMLLRAVLPRCCTSTRTSRSSTRSRRSPGWPSSTTSC